MNILPVGNTEATSTDRTIGSTGQVLLFVTDADGGYAPPDTQVNVEFKAASGQYMRQTSMSFDRPSVVVGGVPGTIFRVKRISGNVGVDAEGVGA